MPFYLQNQSIKRKLNPVVVEGICEISWPKFSAKEFQNKLRELSEINPQISQRIKPSYLGNRPPPSNLSRHPDSLLLWHNEVHIKAGSNHVRSVAINVNSINDCEVLACAINLHAKLI